MDSAPPPPGPSAQPLSSAHAQLSPDGQWRWDGFVWQPTTLPDATLQPNAPTSTGPQATFTLNYTETKAALDWLVKRKDQMLVRIICALFLIGVGAQELLNHANGGLFLGALGVYALGRFAYRVYVTIPRAATKLTTPPDPQRLIFTESGLHIHGSTADGELEWSAVSHTYEHAGMYFLKSAKRPVHQMVPARAFANPATETEFRDLVKRHTRAKLLDPPSPETT
jgi:hypothetical protein